MTHQPHRALATEPARGGLASQRITLLRDGVEALPAMRAAIEAAERECLLEMYWLDDSAAGRDIVDALTARARAGVRVRLTYDAIGSLGVDPALYDGLRAAGGEVREFNPIAPWRRRFALTLVSQRDHRKLLVIDGRVAFVGGLNLGKPWLPRALGGEGWRDDVARIEGDAAGQVRAMFFDIWARLGGQCPPDLVPRTARELTRDTRAVLLTESSAAAGPQVAVLGHDAWGARRTIRRAYLSRIRRARRRVYIANAYFVPDGTVCRALQHAARRGVEVRVIVPRVSDVPPVTWAGQHLYGRLLRAGVHIHEWTDGILHNKSGLIDDWATVGSYNLDYISLRHNLEANMVSTDAHFVAAMEASFRTDLSDHSEELDPIRWAKRGWRPRMRSYLFYLLRKFL